MYLLWFFLFAPFAWASGLEFDDALPQNPGQESAVENVWPKILGKKNLDPRGMNFAEHAFWIGELTRSVESIVRISYQDLDKAKKQNAGGSFNDGIYFSKWQGREVVLKLPPVEIGPHVLSAEETRELLLHEVYCLLLVNQLGLGPEFLGITQTPRGMAIVMEKMSGTAVRQLSESERQRDITNHHLQQMLDQTMKLVLAAIVPTDLQFMVSYSKAEVVDVGLFWTQHRRLPEWLRPMLRHLQLDWPLTLEQAMLPLRAVYDLIGKKNVNPYQTFLNHLQGSRPLLQTPALDAPRVRPDLSSWRRVRNGLSR